MPKRPVKKPAKSVVVETPKGAKRQKKEEEAPSTPSEAFVAIHLGAGDRFLSERRKTAFKELCQEVCSKSMAILLEGGSADDAATAATGWLEDSGLVNAGTGSSLTIEGKVECDAGFMSGDGHFGGVGAMPGVKNPIQVAKKIADLHRIEPILSCGRVPPLYLSGAGAKEFAESHGIPVWSDKVLTSESSMRKYRKYMERVKEASNENGNISDDDENSDGISDTVGAIVIDKQGHVAATVSSGGNWLKHSGRMGHAPAFGSGCWASNINGDVPAIAVSASGSGEMLAKVQLPKLFARDLARGKDLLDVVLTVIQDEFWENKLLDCHKELKNLGIIAATWNGQAGELAWGHTSKSFAFGYMPSNSSDCKVVFSQLPSNMKSGGAIQVAPCKVKF